MNHTKHPTKISLVKAALTLAHGNTDVEKGFSYSDKTVAADRSRLSKASINILPMTTYGLKVAVYHTMFELLLHL